MSFLCINLLLLAKNKIFEILNFHATPVSYIINTKGKTRTPLLAAQTSNLFEQNSE